MMKILKSKLFYLIVLLAVVGGVFYFNTKPTQVIDQVDVTDSLVIESADTTADTTVAETVDSLTTNTTETNE